MTRSIQLMLGMAALTVGLYTQLPEAKAGDFSFGVTFGPNPVVVDTGRRYQGAEYDPWRDQYTVRTHRDIVRASAYDDCRDHVDPGSRRYVRRYARDERGRLVIEQGWTWTSHGVPHGDLTKTRVSNHGGTHRHDNTHMIYSQPAVQHEDETHVQYRNAGRGPQREPGVQHEDSTRVQYFQARP